MVEIWLFEDNGLMVYGGFKVNLAAGLEDSLINELKPKWNGVRLNTLKNKLINEIKVNETLNENDLKPIYSLKLSRTYYDWKCLNIGKNFSNLLGEHDEKIEIFVENSILPLEVAKIDRNANSNNSVRIRPDGSKNLKKWFHDNFKLNDTVHILIESLNKVRILKNN